MFVDLAEHPPLSSQDASTGELPFSDLPQVCYSYEEVNSPNYRHSSLCSLTLQNRIRQTQSGFPPPPPLLTQPKKEKERTEWRGREEKEQREDEEEEGQIQQRERSQAAYSTSWRILKAWISLYIFYNFAYRNLPSWGLNFNRVAITTQTKKNAWVMVRSQNPSWIPV